MIRMPILGGMDSHLIDTFGRDLIAALDPVAAERIAKLRQPLPCESGSFFARKLAETMFVETTARLAA